MAFAAVAEALWSLSDSSAMPGLAMGLMVFEKLIRYAGLAVGLKPSAMECEARLRGLCRI